MKKTTCILFVILISACAEKLLDKPNNLIAKDTMVEILNDLAILNAAKNTNVMVLKNHGIEPMPYIFSKYNIDSLQFVESDRYYASIPELHEKIYEAVTEKLEKEEGRLSEEKQVNDSLKRVKSEASRKNKQKVKDSLSQSGDKKIQ